MCVVPEGLEWVTILAPLLVCPRTVNRYYPVTCELTMTERTPAKKRATKTVKVAAKKTKIEKKPIGLDYTNMYGDTLDVIEKRQNFETSSVEDIPPMSTSMLSHDMLLGGGIRPSWYSSIGAEQSAKTTSALTIMASAVKNKIPLVHFSDYEGSSSSSGPYIKSILESVGLKITKAELFGKKDDAGKWLIPPKVRYRSESALEAFFDYMHAVLSDLPDKRFIANKWWLVFEDNKQNKIRYGEHADDAMPKRHGSGIWVPAPDGNLQAIFFVDSYPAMLPSDQDKEEGNNSLALQARSFSKHIPRVKGRMARKMVAVVGINQLRAVPMAMFGPKENEPGGNALKLYSDARIKHTSRALSAAPFPTKAGKDFNEIESSVEFEGGVDKYRYVHMKTTKNKLSMPGRESFIRIWIEDGQGQARGLCPVFDTIYYLKETGQISGKRSAFKLNIKGLETTKKPVTWDMLKKWILGTKEDMTKISTHLGLKPMSIRAYCFKQMRDGVAEELYIETKQSKTTVEDDEE